ncbi:iron-containing alcohol dehydrogenase [Enterococcus hulanensis]|uniref:iron-containing alcohol dehydrogenase n=1 Tax=Enterococcus hulanensis TaxID=2559929 RepID=UPI001A8F67FB|nr:iron-containing alcohol dehydrogenase [Enterococcus hulanensis]MBO0456002.1 iron-containing alcohol dehydrogenase [Enterococcus hulanensis]
MWKYYQPVNVMFGEGELENLVSHLNHLNVKKAFVLADSFLVENGLVKKIQQKTGAVIGGFTSDIEPNPTIQNVESAVNMVKEMGADCLIAFGGGSVMDCAKATAAAVAHDCDVQDLISGMQINKALPIIAIPTTAGTGSEVTAGAVLSDKEKGIKTAIFSPAIFPKLAIVDPVLTYSVPKKVTAITGIDVLAHAFDAMTSKKANDVTDALALQAAKLAIKNLPKVVSNGLDKKARNQMSKASTIAGLAFSQTGTTASHACSYILTAKYNVPHGEACAFTLDSWIKFSAKIKPELEEYAQLLGFETVDRLADWLNHQKAIFGLKRNLSDIGINKNDLKDVVEASMSSANMTNNIGEIKQSDVLKVFESKV